MVGNGLVQRAQGRIALLAGAVALVPLEYVVEAFVFEHGDGLAQAVENLLGPLQREGGHHEVAPGGQRVVDGLLELKSHLPKELTNKSPSRLNICNKKE